MSETISPNTTLAHYSIISKIGAGGMGEVYRARDTRLDREVAIKILPPNYATDPDRLKRFEQEARATSALNHPNILTVYDVGKHKGTPYIVAELLSGSDLRALLNEGPMPVRKAVEYAQQITRGLAAAHQKGIVHRDLKPENLFVTSDNRVKILDFGLAKLTPIFRQVEAEAPTNPMSTASGLAIGTVFYMSPEQARGERVDHRSDIFALGGILYEMVTGTRAFQRTSAIETLNAILKEDPPDLSQTDSIVPLQLERIIRRCLEKNPDQRFQSTNDLVFALETLSAPSDLQATTESLAAATNRGRRLLGNPNLAWFVAAVTAVAALIITLTYIRRESTAGQATFTYLPLPMKTTLNSLTVRAGSAISPDGRRVAVVAWSEGESRLWLYSLEKPEPQMLPGTESASYPFWSPDSRFIGFFSQSKLKKIDISGGPPQILCATTRYPFGGTWNKEGIILFSQDTIYRIPASGGVPQRVTVRDESQNEMKHGFPSFLPDGRHFVYLAITKQRENQRLCIASVDDVTPKRLVHADSGAVYAPGYLFFVRGEKLLAQSFDINDLEVTGAPATVADQIVLNPIARHAEVSVSSGGVLAYRTGSATKRELVWVDRAGRVQRLIEVRGDYLHIDLSPDEKRAVGDRLDASGGTWLIDLTRNVQSPLSSDFHAAVWSSDSKRVIFVAVRDNAALIVQLRVDGNNKEEVLARLDVSVGNVTDYSADGQYIMYVAAQSENVSDLWVLPLNGREPRKYGASEANEYWGRLSRDGGWVAYVSNATGIDEIYVQSFPEPGEKILVSKGGGSHPRWSRDGKELFYMSANGKLMAVPVRTENDFHAGEPTSLFEIPIADQNVVRYTYAVANDGQRFLVIRNVDGSTARPLTLVQNWTAPAK